jgi:hypothetical protein
MLLADSPSCTHRQDATVERGVAYVALGIVVANMSHL